MQGAQLRMCGEEQRVGDEGTPAGKVCVCLFMCVYVYVCAVEVFVYVYACVYRGYVYACAYRWICVCVCV